MILYLYGLRKLLILVEEIYTFISYRKERNRNMEYVGQVRKMQ